MKKLVIAAIALMISIGAAYAQGQVNFATKVGAAPNKTDVKFVDASGAGVHTPPYSAALEIQGAPGVFTLVPGSISGYRTDNPLAAGYVSAGAITIPGHDVGSTVTLRVTGFLGTTEADYNAAVAAGVASQHIAFSGPVDVSLGGGAVVPPNLGALSGTFTLVPEPSTIAFGLLGAAALLIRRRK
jgi:hypothetical protein